jgi:hypothetical protein
VDNSQNSTYNAWQTSIRKRFSHSIFFDAHYTFSKGLGITGLDIGAYYGSDNDQGTCGHRFLSARTGSRLIISETCASNWFCRPDYVGGATIVDNWQQANTTRCTVGARCNVQYLNRAAFALVPVDPNSRIAIRPGNLGNAPCEVREAGRAI